MALRDIYGIHDGEDQVLASYKTSKELCRLLEHPSPWVRKDTMLLLTGMVIDTMMWRGSDYRHLNEGLVKPAMYLLDSLKTYLPIFYAGDGFPIFNMDIDVGGRSAILYATEEYDILPGFLQALDGGFDYVLGIHAGGLEASIMASYALGVPLALG